MTEPQTLGFSTRAEFESQLRECLACARTSLQLFDADFTLFPLGESRVDAILRAFLTGGGTLQLAMHSPGHIERHYPRFLRLIRDFAHRIECRVTSAALQHLTDSFCIADGVHIVRRYHRDHVRGEAGYNAPTACETASDRFAAIWAESRPALHATRTGL